MQNMFVVRWGGGGGLGAGSRLRQCARFLTTTREFQAPRRCPEPMILILVAQPVQEVLCTQPNTKEAATLDAG
jgi:hypothetical protein